MMAPPWPWAVMAYCQPPQGSVSPKDEGFLTDSLRPKGADEEECWDDRVAAGFLCFHEQVTAPLWAPGSSKEQRNLEC